MLQGSVAFWGISFVTFPYGALSADGLPCGDYTMSAGNVAVIKSKNYPSNYPNRHNCYWTFEVSFANILVGFIEKFQSLSNFLLIPPEY